MKQLNKKNYLMNKNYNPRQVSKMFNLKINIFKFIDCFNNLLYITSVNIVNLKILC